MTTRSELHLTEHTQALASLDINRLQSWGHHLAHLLTHGGRLLIAGNGGSAAEAQHLSAELLGRYRRENTDRPPLPALALHADTSTLTALANDFGYEQTFARQVQAHGRPGDVLLILTTSGTSPNILAALHQARALGLTVWALTGPGPNPTIEHSDEAIPVTGTTAHVQEAQLVAIHLLCDTIDTKLTGRDLPPSPGTTTTTHGPDPLPPRAADIRREPTNSGRTQVVVIGDALLDETLDGPVLRISPEAPVPVVSTPGQHYTPGGAGLAALLAASHSCDGQAVTLITALNDDQASATLLSLLSSAGVEVINLGTDAPTAVKTRIRSNGQTLLMLDRATPATTPTTLTSAARTALRNASAILVSDYGRGITAHPDTRNLLSELASHIPVVWDPHPRGSAPVPGTTMITPNSSEAHHFATPGVSGQPPITGLAADTQAGEALLKLWKAKHIAVTRGSHGTVLVSTSGTAPLVIPAPAVNAVDTCGAGDAFAADITTQLAIGVLPTTATAHAVQAAAAFVAKQSVEQRECSSPGTTNDILQRVARRRAEGATIVATGGCFDLLHRGHITMLQQARALGDLLVVCLNSDESVTRLKGHPRPLVTAADRAAVLRALGCVDEVVIFDEDTPEQILGLLRPDVFVKGGDYAAGDLPERTTIEAHGGHIVLVPYLDGRSSTHIINRATSTTPHTTA